MVGPCQGGRGGRAGGGVTGEALARKSAMVDAPEPSVEVDGLMVGHERVKDDPHPCREAHSSAAAISSAPPKPTGWPVPRSGPDPPTRLRR